MNNKKIKILICDDDKYFRMALKDQLNEHGLIFEASQTQEAIEKINSEHFDIVLIDMEIDESSSGIKILKAAKSQGFHSIILSSQGSESSIEEAYSNGCDHYLSKFYYKTHLEPYIYKYKKNLQSNQLGKFFKTKYLTGHVELIDKIKELCNINLVNRSLFITGETGVGKSLIAELLHSHTHDSKKPFIHLNCSELSESLLESELFGHKKGSFTGADKDKIGKLELADQGTLFLDEVATMPMSMQQKLLKAIDQKVFYPVGSDKPVRSEFTLITATCEDLLQKIENQEFRKDLFYRINGLNLYIPPLRERKDDIRILLSHFISQSPRRFVLKAEARQLLAQYEWPGNIRELKKTVDILSTKEKGILTTDDLSFILTPTTPKKYNGQNSSKLLTPSQESFISEHGLKNYIKLIEEESIKLILDKNNGKVAKTIKDLKISASAFYRIFDQLKTH